MINLVKQDYSFRTDALVSLVFAREYAIGSELFNANLHMNSILAISIFICSNLAESYIIASDGCL